MPNFEYPEGATSIDPNDIDGLLLTHITTRSELDRWEQDNIVVALAWLDTKKAERYLQRTIHKGTPQADVRRCLEMGRKVQAK